MRDAPAAVDDWLYHGRDRHVTRQWTLCEQLSALRVEEFDVAPLPRVCDLHAYRLQPLVNVPALCPVPRVTGRRGNGIDILSEAKVNHNRAAEGSRAT